MWFRRIFLFILTNLAVVLLLGIIVQVFGLDQWLQYRGVAYGPLLIFSALFGFIGSFISLAISKWMALRSTGARIIEQPRTETESWLLATVERQARAADIGTPQVAIFPSSVPNAFATGARRDHALVAVSAGLLQSMGKREVEAVLAHEISHVANGDMITLSLLQGVVNTFVIFLSRALGSIIDGAIFGSRRGRGMGYFAVVMALQFVFGVLASTIVMAYSRRREFRADAGSAKLEGKKAMISALLELGKQESDLPPALAAFGIKGGKAKALFRSHPTIEQRIEALEALPD